MLTRRKVLLLLPAGIAIVAILFAALRPNDEPKYQGRSLSEWLEFRNMDGIYGDEVKLAESAVQSISTNAVPYLVKWIRYEWPGWRGSLQDKLPSAISEQKLVRRLLEGSAERRAIYAVMAFRMIGTNGAAAIPELEKMAKDRSKPATATKAITALLVIGEPAIPALTALHAMPLSGCGLSEDSGTNTLTNAQAK